MTAFNIDKTLTVDAEIEKGCKARVAHLWDEDGNCLQEKLGVARWANVKGAIQYLLADTSARSATTECGLTVSHGKA